MTIDTHGQQGRPWTGFDLDGTLAEYDGWKGVSNIGVPVKPMCDLIKRLHDDGKAVKILTARVAPKDGGDKKVPSLRGFSSPGGAGTTLDSCRLSRTRRMR